MTTSAQNNKYLIFTLEQNLYGLAVEHVFEIIEYQSPTKIPNLPPYIPGLLNLRGKVLPIIDFNLYLGQKNTIIAKNTSAIIINYYFKNKAITLGILVDAVLDVVEISELSLEHVPDLSIKIKPEFIQGMFILNDKIVTLLDINRIFSETTANIIADIPKSC